MDKALTASQLAERRKKADEDFGKRVVRQAGLAKTNPSLYRLKVRFLGFSGYAFIFGCLLLTAGLFIAVLLLRPVSQLLLLLGFIFVTILRSLWIKISPPEGIELDRSQVPELFQEIDKISCDLKSIRIEKVLIDDETNAQASQIPRFGLIGPAKNYLIIGLPLLLSLSPDEFRSVLAHEFGHFSGQHGKFGSWVYRINETWDNLRFNLGSRKLAHAIFGVFFDWFQPRFSAATFVLRRENEHEADSVACQIAGKRAAATALVRIRIVGPLIDQKFWVPYYARVKSEPTPPEEGLNDLVSFSSGGISPDFSRPLIEKALARKTDYSDTHPCLRERLAEMGYRSDDEIESLILEVSRPLSETAAVRFTSRQLDALLKRVNRNLITRISGKWKRNHQYYQDLTVELNELDRRLDTMPLSQKESLRRAVLISELRSDTESIPHLKSHLQKFPDDVECMFLYGQSLLDSEDPEGVGYLRKAMKLDPRYSVRAIDAIGTFESKRQNEGALSTLRDEMYQAQATSDLSRQEARQFRLTDVFYPHGLDTSEVREIVKQFETRDDIKRVYLARKYLPSMPHKPRLTLICIRKKKSFERKGSGQAFASNVLSQLRMPEEYMLYTPVEDRKWIRKMENQPKSLIYDSKVNKGRS